MVTRSIDWRVRTIGSGIFLTNSLKVFEVNSTAAKVFLMCDGKHDTLKMITEMKLTFQTECSSQEIEDDIFQALAVLKEIGAIQGSL